MQTMYAPPPPPPPPPPRYASPSLSPSPPASPGAPSSHGMNKGSGNGRKKRSSKERAEKEQQVKADEEAKVDVAQMKINNDFFASLQRNKPSPSTSQPSNHSPSSFTTKSHTSNSTRRLKEEPMGGSIAVRQGPRVGAMGSTRKGSGTTTSKRVKKE